ncbi:MAG: hypothetical protein IJ403_01575 [Oscillospiraceae bacterium]|nr:hypothetical protein [Oscillospiraceae bacterium]
MSLYVKYISAPKFTNEKMQISSDSGQLGDPALLAEGYPDTPWATLEPQGWPLDGTRDILSDSPENIGWWSKETSEENGIFSNENGGRPILQLVFPQDETFSAPGITFQFWPSTGEWCNEVVITWYCNDEAFETVTAYPDSSNWFFKYGVDGFNKIEVEFISTNIPEHFAKLQQIQLGQTVLFFQDELVRVSLLNEIDPSSCELSADELTVEIRDSKNRKLNIRKDHRLELYRNNEIIASHYIKDYTREGENKLTLKAQSTISILEDTFLGGLYNKDDKVELPDVLGAVLGDIPYVLDASLESKPIGYLPVCTKREALQQIAFAVGAYVTTQGDGTIKLNAVGDPLTAQQPGFFDKDKILSGSSLSQIRMPKGIQVTAHKYTQSDEQEILAADATVYNDPNTLVDEVVLVFSEPHWGYACNPYFGEAQIAEEHPHWVRITGSTGAVFEVTGKKYVHTTVDHSWTNPDASEFGGDTIKIENATLITDENVQEVIERLKAYYSLENSLNGTVVVEGQKAGDIVEIANPFGNDLTVGYITKMESEFTATGHTASIEVRGADRSREDAEVLQ